VNAIILNGRVIGNPKASLARNGVAKTIVIVETDGRDLPLRFTCIGFGYAANAASKVVDGDEVLVCGRLAADSNTKTMSVICNSIELFYMGDENDSNKGNDSPAAVPTDSK
jgi:hypothetical protein